MLQTAFFGSLARDSEVKTAKSGKPYMRFSVRVSDGDDAQYVSVMAFDAETIGLADKLVKGASVYVEGKLALEEYEKDGIKRQSLTAMAWHCRLSQIGRNKPRRDQD
jgi:single-stranded DNA-binding protein